MNGVLFDQFVLKFAADLVTSGEIPERLRTQMSVVLFKRFRGETLGDRIGRWNYQTNNYVEPSLTDLAPYNIFTKNIVKKIVRANAATMSQATIAIECEPRQQTSLAKKNALITSKVCEWVEQFLWTPQRLHQINTLKQLSPGVFVDNYWDKSLSGGEYETSEWGEESFEMPGQFACPQCGEANVDETDPVGESEAEAMCSNCNVPMVSIEDALTETIPVEKKGTQTVRGDNAMAVYPGLEFRLDERYSQGANIDACQWAEHHPLRSKYEIEAEFGVKDLAPPSDWSYSMKWLYTLRSGAPYPFKSYKQTQETLKKLDLYEVRYLYLSPEWLSMYTADVEFEFKNAKGEVEFVIKPNENARDVVMRMAQEQAEAQGLPYRKNGLCVAITGKRVLGIYLADFKRQLKNTYFVSDPTSVWPLAYSELEPMQHLANQTLTAIANQVISNQNVLIVDREAYDADDVEGSKNVIYTREGLSKPINDTWGFLPATSVTPDSWRMVDWADMSADEVGMTSKEMQGQPSDAKTFGQAQLNRDQSVGVLTPAQQSLGECKVTSFMEQCRIAQEHWPFERMREMCESTEGRINDEDIEAWFKSDLDRTVLISYRPGSEQPKSFVEKKNSVADVAGFIGNMAAVAPQIMSEQVATELVNEFVGYSGVNTLNLGNKESDTEITEKRYEIILQRMDSEMQNVLAMPPEMLPQGDLVPMVVQRALNDPLLVPLPQENHAVEREFWIDKSANEFLKEDPDLMLIMAFQEMIERHRKAAVGEGQTLVKSQMEIEAPAQAQQSAMAAEQNAAATQSQADQLALNAAQQENADQLERERIEAENYRTEVDAGSQVLQQAMNAENQGN